MSRSHRLIRSVAALALALAPACADEAVTSDDEVGDGDGDDGQVDGDGDGDGGAEGDGDGDGDDPPAELGGPARGLMILAVEVNQGTGVEVVRDDQVVASEERNAKLIRNRDTLIRVHHVIDDPDAWVPRELTGVLHIQPPTGPELLRTRTFTVTGDSDPRKLSNAFYFSLLADEALPGTELWIELRETDASLDVSSLSPGLSTTPVAPFEFEDLPLALRVVLVPVLYEYLDPPRIPDITDEDLALFHDLLLQQNPVQTVEFEVRPEPIVRTQQLTSLGALLAPTREVRLQDGVGPNVYYHALVDVGGPSVNQVAGIAMLTDASKADASDRVAVTVYHKHVKLPDERDEDQTPTIYPPVASARTFVHEVGHNQGFRHVACPSGDAAGPDPDYPHDDGKIGVYGFGIRDFHIYTPGASHDYMSYCGNSWVSDWTWNKALARIEVLTSWEGEGAGSPTLSPVLVGVLSPEGAEEWSVHQGVAPSGLDPSGARVEYSVAGSIAASVPASVELLSDDATVMVTAPLPIALAELDGITWLHANHQRSISPASVASIRR
ncbi:MAG: hypothetical protein R6X02_04725 [Enhygromyxa sp.]